MPSADIILFANRMIGPKPGLIKDWAWPGSKLFEGLKVFMKDFFKKVEFEINLQTIKKYAIAKLPIIFGFVALRPKSTSMVIAGRSVHLTTLFLGRLEQAVNQ